MHYSLGAHCCDTNHLFTHCPEDASLTTIFSPEDHDDTDVYAADVDRDGNVELVYTDWTFRDFIPLEDAQRSVPDRAPFRRLLAWTRGSWHVAPLTRGRKAFYARSLADTLALRPKDATDDWEIGTVGTRRGLVVGVYSHLGGASRPGLLRDIRKALQAEVPREFLVHFDGSPLIVEQLDGFDASRVGVVWSSRGTQTRGTRRDE